ncbi:pitrilysin family protein [Ruminococcus sp. YE282]|uniref:EF-P 5-aminopentanol modification-associated protein YfmH n=1 Tax=Ruminococcus sp. YE282 TaxID=3158780 RepID=UPI00087FE33B|nr:Predicted Zn-dependent peptidase [Ruminococcus bromii]
MKIQEIKSDRAGDSYYKINHPTGLTVYVYPKEGYKSAYAIIGTKYGSINTCFSCDGGEKITVPDGIAHYLEHKLFESEEGDVFAKFAQTGANANAYTSFEKTCYLFSCTSKFDESFEMLLDFVQDPYFTAQTVAKEQGIIGQEIKMYDDSPDWRVMFNMLGGMYQNHPVKIDIAGTVETIAQITAEKLYQVYNVFYNLGNMALCVAGNVTPEQVLKICDKMLKNNEKHEIKNYFEDEPYEIAEPYVEQNFPVSMPMFNLGFKEKTDSVLTEKQLAETNILLSMLASPASSLYRSLMDANLINSTFSYELFDGPGYCSVIFGGESRAPKQAAEMIKQFISKYKANGLNKEDFDIARKSVYGDVISSLNSVSSIANAILDYHFNDNEFFKYINAVENASFEDVNAKLQKMLDVNNCTLSVVKSPDGEV